MSKKETITSETILFEYGADGGGATVYRLPDGKVIEKGSSGGILDEDEDPIRKWEREYDNWDAWWQDFTGKQKESWIWFTPVFIHNDIKDFIQQAVNNYKSDFDDGHLIHRKRRWQMTLDEVIGKTRFQ